MDKKINNTCKSLSDFIQEDNDFLNSLSTEQLEAISEALEADLDYNK